MWLLWAGTLLREKTKTMAECKSVVEQNANALIVVPRRVGTFDEFFQILTLEELG